MNLRFLVGLCWAVAVHSVQGQVTNFISWGDSWGYFLGQSEPSSPTNAWRQLEFDDSLWLRGDAPLGFLTNDFPDLKTVLPYGPDTNINYWTAYFRKTFVANDLGGLSNALIRVSVDDGAVVSINGNEVGRVNVPTGRELSHRDEAGSGGALHRLTSSIPGLSGVLVPGTNLMTVHVLNSNPTSPDFYFDASIVGTYDYRAPEVARTTPMAGSVLSFFSYLEVYFNKPVQGVAAGDLLVNDLPATNVVALALDHYRFEFPEPGPGAIQVTFASSHGIQDWAEEPQLLIADGFVLNFTLDPSAGRTSFPIENGALWKYFLGTSEASSPPDAWRQLYFDDSAWLAGWAPLGFTRARFPNLGTELPREAGNGYSSAYFRLIFEAHNVGILSNVVAQVTADDGAVLWLNGTELGRTNVPTGELTHQAQAGSGGDFHRLMVYGNDVTSLMVPGINVLAVHVLNSSFSSPDFYFDASLTGSPDFTPPAVRQTVPPRDLNVTALSLIEVIFTKGVQGVDAEDLLINGIPASNVTALGPDHYLFKTYEPEPGEVVVSWVNQNGILDLGDEPQPFVGESWRYVLDPEGPTGTVLISEFMASNQSVLRDEEGETSDWIELYNYGNENVNLGGWYLSDNRANLVKWRLPETNLPPWSFLIVFASGKSRALPGSPLHTSFSLSGSGEYLALVQPDGLTVTSEFSPVYPPQYENISYGWAMNGYAIRTNAPGFLAEPTPGAPNPGFLEGFAPSVEFSRVSGTFTEPFAVSISTSGTNTLIRYTTDGSEPGYISPLYTEPLWVEDSVQIRARAFVSGRFPGPVQSENYLAVEGEAAAFSSDLPLVVLHTVGTGWLSSDDTFVAMQVFEPREDCRATLTQVPSVTTRGRVHAGNGSKPNFDFEAWDEQNRDRMIPLLGMPPDADWNLSPGSLGELNLLKSALAKEIKRKIGRYGTRERFVELFVRADYTNGPVSMADYRGIYVVSEELQVGPGRLELDLPGKLDIVPPAVTGDYLLSAFLGWYVDSPPSIYPWVPALSDLEGAQQNYLTNYLSAFVNALYSPQFKDPDDGYRAFIELNSCIDSYSLNFALANFGTSYGLWMVKTRQEKLTFETFDNYYFAMGTTNAWSGISSFNPFGGSFAEGYPLERYRDLCNNGLWFRLAKDADFWQQWSDRYQELREPGQALQAGWLHALIERLAGEFREAHSRELDLILMGNPFREGLVENVYDYYYDYASGNFSYDFGSAPTLQGEVDFLKAWFSLRLQYLDSLFLPKPALSLPEGRVEKETPITLSGPPGATIYYTLDGSDPRAPGGQVAPQALMYQGSLVLHANARLTARSFDASHTKETGLESPRRFSPWSGPVRAVYVVETPKLAVTEIMYHPVDPFPFDAYTDEDYAFVELKNLGSEPVNLEGTRFSEGISFTFPNLSVAAGEAVVVVKNPDAFIERYGNQVRIAGAYSGNLDNQGERLALVGPLGEPILDFEFDNGWFRLADGLGFSIVLKDESVILADDFDPAVWRLSSQMGGSPSRTDPPPPVIAPIKINELLTHPVAPYEDTVEFYNPTAAPVDLGGWYLTDAFNSPKKFRFPPSTFIPAGGYLAIDEHAFNPSSGLLNRGEAFSFAANGDDVYLFSGNAADELTGYVHGFSFGGSAAGVFLARHANSHGEESLVPEERMTLFAPNAGLVPGPVVISEIMYHPPAHGNCSSSHLLENSVDEFVEIYNRSSESVAMFTTNVLDADGLPRTLGWSLGNAVEFTFSTNLSLLPGELAVVVGFDPAREPVQAATFRSTYGLAAEALLLGPFQKKLDNGSETVTLRQPQPNLEKDDSDGDKVVRVEIDRVHYSSRSPWPEHCSGTGASLQRRYFAGFGNDPVRWIAAVPTPGKLLPSTGNAPVIVAQPVGQTVEAGSQVVFAVEADGDGPLRYQWRVNGRNLARTVEPILTLENIEPAQNGVYEVLVMNERGVARSQPFSLEVVAHPQILWQTSLSEPAWPGQDLQLMVAATASRPLFYQWRKGGVPIPGATQPWLTLTNLQIADQAVYDVMVSDRETVISSPPIELLISPDLWFDIELVDQSAAEGSDVILGVQTQGALPILYSWYHDGGLLTNQWLDSFQAFLTLPRVGAEQAGTYTVTLSNALYVLPDLPLSSMALSVLADGDGDGLPDEFEIETTLNPADPADGARDEDGDGLTNLEEYRAGTDLRNAESNLQIHLYAEGYNAGNEADYEPYFDLSFSSKFGRTYTIQSREASDRGEWKKIADVLGSPGGFNYLSLPPPWLVQPSEYYRVVTPRQPDP